MLEVLDQYGGVLLTGTILTIVLTFGSYLVALVVGLLLALARLDRSRLWLYLPAQAFVEFIRGTPLLVQLFYLFFVLPFVGIRMDPITTGIVGLGINYAAYMSEVYRGGIEAVEKGQWEAAHALAMPWWLTMRVVVLPQAVRIIIPPMGNYLVSLFKDTALVATISITELTFTARLVASQTFRYLEVFTVILIIYFLISFPASRAVAWLERRLKVAH